MSDLEKYLADNPSLGGLWQPGTDAPDYEARPYTGAETRFAWTPTHLVVEMGGQAGAVAVADLRALEPKPVPTGLRRAIDVADGQPGDLTPLIAATQSDHVVVKLYTSAEIDHTQRSRDQIASARANQCSIGGYVFLYHGVDTAQQARDGIALARSCGLDLPILWIDVEEYQGVCPTRSETMAAVEAAKAEGVPVGIYTGDWVIAQYWGGNAGELAVYPLWLAVWNGNADLNVESAYWPSELILGHQYRGSPLDLDVFNASVTGA